MPANGSSLLTKRRFNEMLMRMMKCLPRFVVSAVLLAGICGCQSPRYYVLEQPFQDSQQILRKTVENARDRQERLKRESQVAFGQLQKIANSPAANFDDLFLEYRNQCWHLERRSNAFSKSVAKLEVVARDYFANQEARVEGIEDALDREHARADLDKMRERYEQLHNRLLETEEAVPSIVKLLNDQIALLRESPTPESIQALASRLESIEQDLHEIDASLDQSITEAYLFISWIPV